MSFDVKTTLRLTLLGVSMAAIAACASHPKPEGPGPVAEAPPPAYSAPPPGPVNGQILPGSVQDFVINVGDRVYFDFDQYGVRADAVPVLSAQAAWLNRYQSVQVRIEGNCDERGTREYNLALGARRANSARDFLVSHGVSPARIATISYGKERPVDPGENEDAWQHDRNAHTAITGGAR